MAINVGLLQRIKKHILESPLRMDMSVYVVQNFLDGDEYVPPCGTAACIAGWAVLLSLKPDEALNEIGLRDRAVEFLGLDSCALSAYDVFHVAHWPEPYQSNHAAALPVERAQAVADYIDYLIKTHGGKEVAVDAPHELTSVRSFECGHWRIV